MIPKFNTIIKNKKNVTNEDLSSSIQHLVFQKKNYEPISINNHYKL